MINHAREINWDESIELIVHRARNGDQTAFMDLVDRFHGMAYASAYAIVRNKQDAEDAVQEAFIQAYRYLHTLDNPNRFAPWLRSIIRQRCYGLIRVLKRRFLWIAATHSDSDPVDSAPSSARDWPSTILFHAEIWERSMAALSRRSREIVLLYYMEGYTCSQIADLLQLSEGAIKSHLHKARKKIEDQLRKLGVRSADCLG